MQILTSGKLFQYYLPATLTLFMLITIERTVVTDGGFDRLWGCPLPYITSAYAFTWVYDIFVLALLFDLLFYFILTILLFAGLQKLGIKLKTHWSLVVLGVVITSIWCLLFIYTTSRSFFYLKNNTDYKTISTKLVFGHHP